MSKHGVPLLLLYFGLLDYTPTFTFRRKTVTFETNRTPMEVEGIYRRELEEQEALPALEELVSKSMI